MFRAIGTLLLIWGVVQIFSSASKAFEDAAVAIFTTIATSAEISEQKILSQ